MNEWNLSWRNIFASKPIKIKKEKYDLQLYGLQQILKNEANKSAIIYSQNFEKLISHSSVDQLNWTMTELVKLLIISILMNTALETTAKATNESQKLEKEVIEYLCAPENLEVIYAQCENCGNFLSRIFGKNFVKLTVLLNRWISAFC